MQDGKKTKQFKEYIIKENPIERPIEKEIKERQPYLSKSLTLNHRRNMILDDILQRYEEDEFIKSRHLETRHRRK